MLQPLNMSSIEELKFVTDAAWTGSVIYNSGTVMTRITNCTFTLSSSADLGSVIAVNFYNGAQHCRVKDCWFFGVSGTNRIGVNYDPGAFSCADVDCLFS
jgi:hypothetical protein